MSNKLDKLQGFARQENLDAWAARANANSECAPRATSKMNLPSTGKAMELRDTDMGPKVPRKVNRMMAGKD